jgi:hypothetical protein
MFNDVELLIRVKRYALFVDHTGMKAGSMPTEVNRYLAEIMKVQKWIARGEERSCLRMKFLSQLIKNAGAKQMLSALPGLAVSPCSESTSTTGKADEACLAPKQIPIV